MSKIESTKDYKIFKYLEYNRDIENCHVQNLIASIKQKNMLSVNPIIVTSDMEIIDGQHRLMAAKAIGCPVFYIVQDDYSSEDIVTYNTLNRNWKLDDFLKKYATVGNVEYIKLNELKKDLQISLTILLKWIAKSETKEFRKGNYKFKIDEGTLLALIRMKKILEFMKDMNFKPNTVFTSTSFHEALKNFLTNPLVNFDRFIKNIEMRFKAMRSCYSAVEYMEMFLEIYNHKFPSTNCLKIQKNKNSYEIVE